MITDIEWNNFVNYNTIPQEVLINISIKLKQHYQLTNKELAIYQEYASKIEDILKNTVNNSI